MTAAPRTKVWDLGLRLWHWAFITTLAVSLYTGLSGDISLFDLHAQAGYLVLVLLAFRLLWGFWGGRHARWWRYGVTPTALLRYGQALFRPGHPLPSQNPHTPPGALMAIALWLVVALQAGSGLFSSDFIFNQGPLARELSDAGVRQATWIHVRAFWLIIALASVHLLALLGYWLLLRQPLAGAMLHGRKAFAGAPTGEHPWRALLTLVVAAVLIRYLIRGPITPWF